MSSIDPTISQDSTEIITAPLRSHNNGSGAEGVGGLPSYPAYRASGVEWLGKIPAHWEVKRIKNVIRLNADVLSETMSPNYALSYVDISNVDSSGQILATQELLFQDAPSRARRRVQHGDTIVSTVRTYLRAIAFIKNPAENLIVSTGFAVLRPKSEVYAEYLFRLAQSDIFVEKVVAYSEGVSYPAINPSRLSALPVILPPLPEQRAIAVYLDNETAKIDALIAKKERLIALLEEKRAALISHAVTKGLDLAAPMKDSGVAWLGEIPAHWDVKRLKFIAEVRSGVAKGRDLGGRKPVNLPYMRVANVQDGYLNLEDVATITVAEDEIERYRLHSGDVLMNEGGDFDKLGRGYVWEDNIDLCLHQNHVFAVRPHLNVNPYWINTITLTKYAKQYFILNSKQTTNLASISSTSLQELPVIMPPSDEIQPILDFIAHRTNQIDTITSKTRQQIDKLREYRAALIAAAVTGKIDVRGAASADGT